VFQITGTCCLPRSNIFDYATHVSAVELAIKESRNCRQAGSGIVNLRRHASIDRRDGATSQAHCAPQTSQPSFNEENQILVRFDSIHDRLGAATDAK